MYAILIAAVLWAAPEFDVTPLEGDRQRERQAQPGAASGQQSRTAGDQQTELAELRAGEIFGEMAVFDPAPAAGTVRASEKCEVWWITREGLESFLDASPAAASRLLHAVVRVLVQRMRAVSANLPATGGRLMEGGW